MPIRPTAVLTVLAALLAAGWLLPDAARADDPLEQLEAAFSEENWRVRDANRDNQMTEQEFIHNARGQLVAFRQRLFALADANGDGVVTREEVALVIARAKVARDGRHLHLTPVEVEQIAKAFDEENFRKRDRNVDGKLTHSEFLNDARGVTLMAHRLKLFFIVDQNDDGFVTRAEVRHILHGSHAPPPHHGPGPHPGPGHPAPPDYPSIGVIEDIFAARDRNQDGRLTRQEFVQGTPRELQEAAHRAFTHFDYNGDGVIVRGEMLDVMMGRRPQGTHDPFRGLDTNRDGRLSMHEFVGRHQGAQAAAMRRQFYQHDRDNDGYLSAEEARPLMSQFEAPDPRGRP